MVPAFARYTRAVVAALGDLVDWWATINEPTVYAIGSFLAGAWPPGSRNPLRAVRVLRQMLRAHGLAYRLIHRAAGDRSVWVGLPHNMRVFAPAYPRSPFDRALARQAHRWLNLAVPQALVDGRLRLPFGGRVPEAAGTMDYFGLNYYTINRVGVAPGRFCGQPPFLRRVVPPTAECTDSGWEIYPDGLRQLLHVAAQFGKPVLITENGIADAHDMRRPRFLLAHLAAVHRALQEQVDVRGYLYWSAWDNFEWLEGLRVRFGLIHVDFATQQRTIRPSGRLFARICRANGIPAADWHRWMAPDQ